MGKVLYLTEKPSVAKDLSRVLPGPFLEHEGYMESDDVILTWAVGHLLQLARPEDYDEKLKRWRMAPLPFVPARFKLVPGSNKKQLSVVKKQITRSDVATIVNACDAGREGELIFAYILQSAGKKARDKQQKRLWLSSMTERAMKDALSSLREPMTELEEAARARSEADWIVGINGTRAATLRLKKALDGVASLGRVQTPTLAILAKREQEIADFKPETYWEVEGDFKASEGSYSGVYRKGRISSKKEAEAIRSALEGQNGHISSLREQDVSEKPPMLYDLTSLQREANSQYGFTAKRTLALAQRLYEAHKLLTYPRTSSRFLPNDIYPELPSRIREVGKNGDYSPFSKYLDGKKLPRQVINDKKVSDHHAIIPTEGEQKISSLKDDEKKIYDLVVRRFLAVFYPEAEAKRTTVITSFKDGETTHDFRTSGKRYSALGWREIYGDVEERELPKLTEGEEVLAQKIKVEEKETKPPKRYSDASLLSAMESAGKDLDDEEAREAMKESGLGTPATRAQILERLFEVEYLEREGRSLQVTPKGMRLVSLMKGNPLLSPELTGNWERELLQIEKGKTKKQEFLGEIVSFAKDTVEELAKLDPPPPERREFGPCPECGKTLLENRKAISCWRSDDPGCGFVVWKRLAGKTLPASVLEELIRNKKTEEEVKGFRGKKGRSFSAHLKLEKKDGKWQTSFNEEWAS